MQCSWPRSHGFDEFWGSLIGTPQYWNVLETYHNETPIDVCTYFTDAITDRAIDVIERYRGDPFFLYVAYNAPHYPLEAPAEQNDPASAHPDRLADLSKRHEQWKARHYPDPVPRRFE